MPFNSLKCGALKQWGRLADAVISRWCHVAGFPFALNDLFMWIQISILLYNSLLFARVGGGPDPLPMPHSRSQNGRSTLCLSCVILARSPRHFSIRIFGRDAFDGVSLVQAAAPLPPVYSHSVTILCYHEPFRCCPLLRAVRAMLKQESSSATKMSNESYSHHW